MCKDKKLATVHTQKQLWDHTQVNITTRLISHFVTQPYTTVHLNSLLSVLLLSSSLTLISSENCCALESYRANSHLK